MSAFESAVRFNDSPHAAPFTIINGSAHPTLARLIASHLQVPAVDGIKELFADGSSHINLPSSVRGSHVFVIQPTGGQRQTDRNIMQAAFLGDAAKRASAQHVTIVDLCPGYSRQDRISGRESVSSRVVLDLYGKYYGSMITMDAHSEQALHNGFPGSVDALHASPLLVPEIRKWNLENVVVVSPDQGGVERMTAFSRRLQSAAVDVTSHAYCIKAHLPGANRVQIVDMAGDVQGKTALVFDDMVDTLGTHSGVAEYCIKRGAKKVYIVAVHPILSPVKKEGQVIAALDRLKNAPVEGLLVTNTLPIPEVPEDCSQFQVVDVSALVAETIFRVANNLSVRTMID